MIYAHAPKCIAMFFLLVFNSCMHEGPSEITKEIEGIYKYKYPSGQVEALGIKNDYTFSQAIYSNESDYISEKTLYKNGGTWNKTGEQLEFDHWLVYCKHRNPDSILTQPHISTMLNVVWYAPNNKHEGLIDVDGEKGYVFIKVKK